MSNSQEKLNENLENFYKLEIPQDIKNILISISRIRSESQLNQRLLKIKNHQYGQDLKELFQEFIWKNIKIEHPEIWENIIDWKSKVIDDQWEITQINNYICSWFVVWTLMEIKFYNHALWSLVLKSPNWDNVIVSMDEIHNWIYINTLTQNEFIQYKKSTKIIQWVKRNIDNTLKWTFNQFRNNPI